MLILRILNTDWLLDLMILSLPYPLSLKGELNEQKKLMD